MGKSENIFCKQIIRINILCIDSYDKSFFALIHDKRLQNFLYVKRQAKRIWKMSKAQ